MKRRASPFISGLQKRWFMALFLLVALLAVDALLLNHAIQKVRSDAHTLSDIGRQRILIDRSGVVARLFVSTPDPEEREHTRDVMRRAVALMKENHHAITRAFGQQVYPFKAQMERYMDALESLLEEDSGRVDRQNPHFQFVMKAIQEERLPEGLQLLERQYKEENQAALDRLIGIAQGAFVFNFLALLLITLFIFRPMARRIKEETFKLEFANRRLEQHAQELEASRRAALNIMEDAQIAREEAEQAQERLRRVVESAPYGILMMNLAGKIVLANRMAEILFERPRKDLLEQGVEKFLPISEDRVFRGLLGKCFEASGKEEFPESGIESRILRPGGREIPVEIGCSLIKMETGKLFLMMTFMDISVRKQAEEIRASEERFRGVIQQAGEALFLSEYSGSFIEVNKKACESLGCSREELLRLSFCEVYAGFSEQHYQDLFRRLKKGKSKTFEGDLRRKDGVTFPAEIHASLIELHQKYYMLSFARDITERKRTEHELREMSIALGNAVEGISRFDGEGHYRMVNKAYCEMLGYDTAEIYHMHWEQTIYPDDLENVRDAYQKMRRSGKSEVEARGLCKDGSVLNQHLVMVRVDGEKHQFAGHYSFVKDITERKYKEALEIKSELISMVAHELRTPLHSVREGISVMLEGLTGELNEDQKDVLITTKSSLDRLVRMVNSVLDFQRLEAGIVEFRLTPNNINDLVHEAVKTAEPLIKNKGLKYEEHLSGEFREVVVDKDRIIQVLLNLLNNAVKFTNEGIISVSTRMEEGKVRVSVSDTGIGIKNDDIPKLFRKFGQLESGKVMAPGGTGLGLIISKKIIDEHHGQFYVESEHKKGSTFSFTLPLVRPGVAVEESEAGARSARV